MSNKRMKLIPEKLYEKLMLISKLNLPSLNDGEEEKHSSLENNLPDEVKVMLYQQAARNLHEKEKNMKNEPIPVKTIDSEITVKEPLSTPVELSENSFSLTKLNNITTGPLGILKYLHDIGVEPTNTNQVSVSSSVIANSDFNQLFDILMGHSNVKSIRDYTKVVEAMQRHPIPKNLFPKRVYNYIMTIDENTPLQDEPRCKKLKRSLPLQTSPIQTRARKKWAWI